MASPDRRLTRRCLMASATGLGALAGLPRGALAALLPTPQQTEGPFYPLELPLDADNDLVQIAGQPAPAAGTILHLDGRVLDPDGRAVRGARVEIWQCDAFGVYHNARDRRGPADPNFQGFGATNVNEDGAWRFRTIEPVPYPGRTPHIHFKIGDPGFEPLTTQMHVAGQPLNARDSIYQALPVPARELVTVSLISAPDLEPAAKSGAKRAAFDIVLGLVT
jgi:protocatechuate 3,4-dioxygenase beta subunit